MEFMDVPVRITGARERVQSMILCGDDFGQSLNRNSLLLPLSVGCWMRGGGVQQYIDTMWRCGDICMYVCEFDMKELWFRVVGLLWGVFGSFFFYVPRSKTAEH